MRLHAFAAALVVASGCAPSLPGSGQAGDPADYVRLYGSDRTWLTEQLYIVRNAVPPADGPAVSFNLVLSYPENLYTRGATGLAPPEIAVWVAYSAGDSLGLGEGSTLTLHVDGTSAVLPSAPDAQRRSLLLRPPRRQRLAEFGEGGEFGLYPLPLEVVRQLGTAAEVRFEVEGTEGDVGRELNRSNLRNVQRFLREPVVQRSLPFLA